MKTLAVAAIILVSSIPQGMCQDDTKDPNTEAARDLRTLRSVLTLYKTMYGYVPTAEQGLAALVHRPKIEPLPKNWMQLLRQMPVDPWGRPYTYTVQKGAGTYELRSLGADLADESDDLVVVGVTQ